MICVYLECIFKQIHDLLCAERPETDAATPDHIGPRATQRGPPETRDRQSHTRHSQSGQQPEPTCSGSASPTLEAEPELRAQRDAHEYGQETVTWETVALEAGARAR